MPSAFICRSVGGIVLLAMFAPPLLAAAGKERPAQRIPRVFMTDDDYPAEAFRLRQEGVVVMQFEVNEKGRVENCSVIESSSSASLDEASCIQLKKIARYRPARDADGKSIRSIDQSRTVWRLPQR